ncbi:MAG: hypothetical protein ACJA0U_002961 [Salibacteraceae bacterium]|jgi:hypothetical protein
MENTVNKSSKVELTLLGIKKTWVRSKGEWRDKNEVEVKPIEVIIHEDTEGSSKRWWRFWK